MTTQHASFMRRTITGLLTITILVGIMAIAALPAGAKVGGSTQPSTISTSLGRAYQAAYSFM